MFLRETVVDFVEIYASTPKNHEKLSPSKKKKRNGCSEESKSGLQSKLWNFNAKVKQNWR